MKKFSLVLAVVATLAGSSVNAQQPAGKGAAAATNNNADSFAWGLGLAGLAVIGTVVGLTVAAATTSQSSYSN